MARGVRRKPVPRKSRVRSGFTLIEILVVVAIIGLLVSILIPSLKKARDMGRRAACLSNLHQMGLGYSGYATENKGKLPMRGHYGYTLKEPKRYNVPGPGGLNREPVNFGLLYGRYVGKNLDIFYCPSTYQKPALDPLYGLDTFYIRNENEQRSTGAKEAVTFSGYMYAIPVACKDEDEGFEMSQSPVASGRNMYPKEIWHPYFADWVAANRPSNWKMPTVSALQSDMVIGNFSPTETAIEGGHGTGLNGLFTDFHAKFVKDPTSNGVYRNMQPSSGENGYKATSELWYYLTRHP